MRYTDLLKAGASKTEIQEYLVGSEDVAMTMRLPRNLRDAAKEAAELSGMNLTSYVKMCLIERLSGAGEQE